MENPNEMDADLGVALFQETSKSQYDRLLVGGLKHLLFFPYVGFLIIPTDFHIFQRGGSTTNQRYLLHVNLFSHEPYSYWPYPICHSGNLQIILFNGIFHDKPSVFGDPPWPWKAPNRWYTTHGWESPGARPSLCSVSVQCWTRPAWSWPKMPARWGQWGMGILQKVLGKSWEIIWQLCEILGRSWKTMGRSWGIHRKIMGKKHRKIVGTS